MPSSSHMGRRVSFHTLGCRLNQAETALFVNRFKRHGYQTVDFGQPTDLLVINTCSVTEGAEADCRNAVRRILRKSPQALVAVTGCYAQTGKATLASIPGIDLVVGNQFKMNLPDYLQALPEWTKRTSPEIRHTGSLDREDFVLEGTGSYEQTRANLKVQDGCNFMCSFCLIPFARGRERSRRLDDARREAEDLVALGHKEVVLTGVNIGQYDHAGATLLDLIQELERIQDLQRIRISSIEPTTISDALVEYMAGSSKLCRFFHVPLQSGDDTLLQAMHRRYAVGDYRRWVEDLMKRIPNVCLGTDVMVGFPGEEDWQFTNTHAMISELPFAYCHVFSYSPRPGTPASRLTPRVAQEVIKRRNRVLTEVSQNKRFQFYQRFVGKTVDVLFESGNRNGLWTGFTDNFVRVGVVHPGSLKNQMHSVVITGVMDGLAIGTMPNDKKFSMSEIEIPLVTLPVGSWQESSQAKGSDAQS